MRTGCAILAALAALAGVAHGQTAIAPDIRIGDQWQFAVYYGVPSTEPNRAWVITGLSANGIEATENGERLLLTRELNVLESPLRAESNPRALAFPLEVGRRWRYASAWQFKPKASKGSQVVDVEVTAYEKIRVAAGEFDAFRLSAKAALSGTSPIGSHYAGEATTLYWYAPAARAIVKSIHHNPYLGGSTVELVTLRLQP